MMRQLIDRAIAISIEFWQQLSIGLLAVLLLVTLGGCTPTNLRTDGGVRLTLWQGVNPPPNRDILQKLVDKFNQQHPDIQVESLYVGQSDRQLPKILAAIVGNAPPDLLWFAPMLTGQLVDLDAIVPLDEVWHKSEITKDIDRALLESMQYENHLWSVPFGTNNVGIFYRPSLFTAAGIDRVPQTWTELQATAKKLTRDLNGDGKIDRYGMLLPLGTGEWTVFTWLPFMWGGGGELAYPNINLANRGAIAALQLWADLIHAGSAILSSPERGYELDNFLRGKVAMQLTGPWTLGQLASTKVDYAVMPIPAGKLAATSIGGENLFMMKTSPERQQAAWKFMEYVLSEEFQTEWSLGTGYLPVNVKARQNAKYREYLSQSPATQVFLDQAKFGRSRPIAPGYTQISENLGRAIESVLLGKNSPQQALEMAQSRLELSFSHQ